MGKPKVDSESVKTPQKKRSESSKGSAAGRNRVKCTRYKTRHMREVNKARRLIRHIRRRGKDLIALNSLKKLEDSLLVLPKDLKNAMWEVLKFHGIMN